MTNLYSVLGVPASADARQIKLAFRERAKTWHPDLHAGDRGAEQRFKEISCAYDILRDPLARAEYDTACAEEAARTRRQLRRSAATMAVSFMCTISFGFSLGIWMLVEGMI
jgi:DnaJ-class molecular chaperone